MAETVGTGPWPGLQRDGSSNLYDSQNIASQDKGSWTPLVIGRTTAGAATNPVPLGRWWRIGNQVHLIGKVGWDTHTGTGEFQIDNLPFQSVSYSTDTSLNWKGLAVHSKIGGTSNVTCYINCNRFFVSAPTYIRFIFPSYVATTNDIASGSSHVLQFDITYYTDFSAP